MNDEKEEQEEELSFSSFLAMVDELIRADYIAKVKLPSSDAYKEASAKGALLMEKIEQLGFQVVWDEFGRIMLLRQKKPWEN